MELIDKNALVAEIDRQKIGYNVDGKHSIEYDTTRKILNIITTLEVKEVDLEKAIDDYIYTNNGRKRMALELDWKQCDITFKAGKLINLARHFFELGLKAQKGEEV